MPSLPPGAGWWSLAVVLALCSRAVGGGAMADPMRAAWVPQACALARSQRQPAAGRSMHTDGGSQDGAASARQLVRQHEIQPRMSRQGTCGENAVAESCFHTFKTAVIEVEAWNTHAQAQTAVCAYIDVCSHRQRCHAAHGSLAPLLDEQT